MAKKVIRNKHRFAAVFASFAVLIVGTLSLFTSMSLDYYSVLGSVQKAVPAAILFGFLGYVMGLIVDKPRSRPKLNYSDYFVKEFVNKDSGIESNLDSAAPAEENVND